MVERKIQPVQDNTEKQQTYRKMLGKYSNAMNQKFFCEALMIDYAMIEDRLRSMIYHMGFLADRNKTSIWKKARPYLLQIVSEYKREKEDDALSITSLNGKIKIVRSVFQWTANADGGYRDNPHLTVLKSRLDGIEYEKVFRVLDDIDRWRVYRNEVVHAMMNKNILQLEETMQPYAEEGMRLARELDAIEREIKAGNRIRRKVRLPMR